jgi:hypothetical protein
VTEAEQEHLRNRVIELEALIGVGNDDISRILTVVDLTPQQAQIVGFMLRRAVATRDALLTVLFGNRPECDHPEPKLIDVQMVKVKRALDKAGIKVQTEWGYGGWSLRSADKVKLRAMMAGEITVFEDATHRRAAFLAGA